MLLRAVTCRLATQAPVAIHTTSRSFRVTTTRHMAVQMNGDLNNTAAERARQEIAVDPTYSNRSFAIPAPEDDPDTRQNYRPFLLNEEVTSSDWISQLELSTALKMVEAQVMKSGEERLRVMVLYGSMRQRSYSRLLAFEASRILFRLGCDVRVYNPTGLPVKDDVQHSHPKVQELRELSKWSDGHVWICPEQHGNLTAVFKNQIDWIPLSTGSVRPTQGRTLAIAQVSGGSQSFNTVNSLRILGRWMRMFAIPNQSSIPKAYTQFTDADAAEGGSRLMPSGNRDRLVDCMEEFVKYSIVMRPHFVLFGDRYSEREEKRVKEEKERLKADELARVRNNQRRCRERRQNYIAELEAKVKKLETGDGEGTVDRIGKKYRQENEMLRRLLASLGLEDGFVNAYVQAAVRAPTVTQKLSLQQELFSHDPLDSQMPSTSEQDASDIVLSQLALEQPSVPLWNLDNFIPSAVRPGQEATLMLANNSSPASLFDTITTHGNNAPPNFDMSTDFPEPSLPVPSALSILQYPNPIPTPQTLPYQQATTSISPSPMENLIRSSSPDATLCSVAYSLILQHNKKGYDFAQLDLRLRIGYKGCGIANGCTVDNKVLFRVLAEIS
ncbi:arsenate resistance ArsH [Lentithecium fluviatile CBS 122367]|uniref:Arsenate resistance ArsH n=1 Tax=Lentithecium fluviatile CBS 122367 TaxID=1168545 RepID=A0A6G1JAB6_9PLEO|nr:arsenate resistance ArsH [Lentithecium fluviatile CBS 122367]